MSQSQDNIFFRRRFVVAGIAVGIVLIYIVRLFFLQIVSDDYKKHADSNAFRRDVIYPSRGLIFDRN
ncbi:MAG: penicillin-binding protein 2, partial [Alloprevotella sp.]|nr:penicillin-binding protein 2 [Alloprevotella sp.]